jgi:tetratricopeptide (TPR) repeat protein
MVTPRALLSKSALVLLTVALALGAGAALAQKKPDLFPNTKRAEPRTSMSEASAKKFNAAQEAMNEENYTKAKESLQPILDNKKSSPYERAMAMTYLANVAWEEDEMAKALDYNQQAIALDAMPNEAQFNAIYQVSQMNLMEERYDASLASIDQWFALTGAETADAWALKGNALYRLDKFPEAAQAIERANQLSTAPNDAWNQMLLASYMEGENYPAAAKAAEGILAKNPQDKDVTLTLASIYNEMEQNDKALAVLEGAYQQGLLKDAKDLKQLYQMYNYLEQPAKAAEVITAGLASGALEPGLDAYRGLGDAYSQSENWDQAIDAYAKAAPYAQDGEMEFQRGHLMIQEKDQHAEGKKAIQAALAKGNLKREGEAWILLGNAEYEMGNEAAAIAAYQKAAGFPKTKAMAESWLKNVKR